MSATAPSNTISPSSRVYAPDRILMSVDLPAPFSPRRACTCPSRTERLTPSSALTPGKVLPIPFISKSTRPWVCVVIWLASLTVCELVDRDSGDHEDAGDQHLVGPVSYTHLRAHETVLDLVCRLLLEKKKKN